MCGFENANEVLKAAQRLKYVFLAAVPPSFECGASVGGRDAFPRATLEGLEPSRAFASVIPFLQLLETSNII